MSRFLIWGNSLLLAIFTMVAAPVQKTNAQPGVSVSFQTFYDALSPHGQWIDDPDYGYVWSPRGVGRDFRPYYSGGNWAMTDYGNTWVSDYPWGWAPFHYGRWAYNPFYGWLWVPGNTWGPAWVHWRGGGNNYGWAPMGPGANININFGGGRGYYPPNDWWTFVPCNRIYHRGGYGRYWRGANYNNTYINNTTIINNTNIYNNNTYVYGPRRSDVERATGQRINVYNVRNDNSPGRNRISGREVNMYRPDVRQDRTAARPQNVVRAERGSGNNEIRRNNNIQQNGAMENRGRGDDRQNGLGNARQRDAQVQQQHVEQAQDRGNRETAIQQQRDVQMQQDRSGRNREMAERQQREMQVQQERRNRETAMQQQREMQVQQERSNRNREMAMQQQEQQQRESQARIQQQRAAEQRAQQQQQIESRRQQRYQQSPQPQQPQSYERRGSGGDRSNGIQRTERSQPQQQMRTTDRGSDSRGIRR